MREVRNKSVACVVFIYLTVRIPIKDGKLPQVAGTCDAEESRSLNIIILRIRNILRTNLGLSEVKTND